jgi:hypothetical protein
MNTNQQNIIAAAALSKIAEIRLYNTKASYDYLIDSHVVELNNKGKELTDINLLDFEQHLNEKQIYVYEKFLENIILDSVKTKYSNSFLKDEIELLSRAQDINKDEFKELSFSADGLSLMIKRVFKSLGINAPSILPIINSSFKVQYIGGNKPNYLCISRLNLRSKEYFVLFHVGKAKHFRLKNLPKNFNIDSENVLYKNLNEDHVFVSSCFIFNPNSIYLMNPVNMFLAGISKYGYEVSINGESKKFHLDGYNSKLEIVQNGKIIFGSGLYLGSEESEKISGSLQITKTELGQAYHFVYSLKSSKFESDIEQRIFL